MIVLVRSCLKSYQTQPYRYVMTAEDRFIGLRSTGTIGSRIANSHHSVVLLVGSEVSHRLEMIVVTELRVRSFYRGLKYLDREGKS